MAKLWHEFQQESQPEAPALDVLNLSSLKSTINVKLYVDLLSLETFCAGNFSVRSDVSAIQSAWHGAYRRIMDPIAKY